MIRPITFICCVAACGSGLYLYQEKHRVQVLDRQIEQTVRATNQLREQTRMLHAEWTLLNDPERLRQLADQFLTLKTVAPSQFTSMVELDARLPPVQIPAPPADPQADTTDMPVAQAEPPPPVKAAEPPPAKAAEPSARAAPRAVAAAAPPRPPEPRPVHIPRPEPAHVAQLRHEVRAEPVHETRFLPPRPMVAAAAPPAFARPMAPPQPTGSLLGMAHGTAAVPAPVPLPRPMPVNAYDSLSRDWGG